MRDYQAILQALLSLAIAASGLTCASGCNSTITALPAEYTETLRDTSKSINAQAIWDTMKGEIEAHAHNPGMEAYIGIEYTSGIRIAGLNAELELGATGHGTGEIPEEYRRVLLERYQRDGRTAFEQWMLKWLEGEKEPAPDPDAPATSQPADGGTEGTDDPPAEEPRIESSTTPFSERARAICGDPALSESQKIDRLLALLWRQVRVIG
jgi:hypothetical protein